ncbi:DUF6461 domain-containing protein [Sphaerisporangium aureirubrum]|uniref:DUF6461 domain-containing protein n=1 Tax=Sphaerisporangium aureirubrum TaxID=1544736 RepID=A0ABW1NJ76_9ACTN
MSYWFDDTAVCVTYVRDLTPEEAFQRLNATPTDDENLDEYTIAAFTVPGGVVLAEPNGFATTLDDIITKLSKGTVVATVFFNVNLDQQFLYAADGTIITQFEPDQPEDRSGSDGDALLPQMRTLQMEEESDLDKAHELAQLITGLSHPAEDTEPDLVGELPEYY